VGDSVGLCLVGLWELRVGLDWVVRQPRQPACQPCQPACQPRQPACQPACQPRQHAHDICQPVPFC
jgi:hypothetical protein